MTTRVGLRLESWSDKRLVARLEKKKYPHILLLSPCEEVGRKESNVFVPTITWGFLILGAFRSVFIFELGRQLSMQKQQLADAELAFTSMQLTLLFPHYSISKKKEE